MLFEVPEWNLGEPAPSKPIKEKVMAQLEKPISSLRVKKVKFDQTRNTVHPIPKAPRKGPEQQLVLEMNNKRRMLDESELVESERKRKKREKRNEARRKKLAETAAVSSEDAKQNAKGTEAEGKNEELEVEAKAEMKLKNKTKAGNASEAKAKTDEVKPKVREEPSPNKTSITHGSVDKHEAKLLGARFRFLNERLYTSKSENALQHFSQNPADFDHYHRGFREQTARWPVNPLDVLIGRLEVEAPKLAKVADLGCGEARLAKTLRFTRPDLSVHSFDLVAVDPELVQVADICNLPLAANSVDFVVICLALMNTNYWQAVAEAHRILRPGGQLWIAEVESRFHSGMAGMEEFSACLRDHFGLAPNSPIDCSHRVFCLLSFAKKVGKKKRDAGDLPNLLKPCLYKKR